MKTEDVLRELEFRFRRGKGNSGAIGTLRIISGLNVDIEKELRAFFTDWQTDFDRVKMTKRMQILKETGINYRERRQISKLYTDHFVKLRLDKEEKRSVKIRRGVRWELCLLPFLFKMYRKYLINEALERF